MSDSRTTDERAKILWNYSSLNDPIQKSDWILALGSHDIRVARRGAELFLQGYAPWKLFSGNLGRLAEGIWTKSEAEIFADGALRTGIPEDKILIENRSTNTGDNFRLAKVLLADKAMPVDHFILGQKPYMQRYAYATFECVSHSFRMGRKKRILICKITRPGFVPAFEYP